MNKQYQITRITEADFGCEELQPGEEVKALVFLKEKDNENQDVKRMEISDTYLVNHGINEGDFVNIMENGLLKKVL